MKVLQVVDITYWAIGKLAQTIEDKNKHIEMRMIAIPPKELRIDPVNKMAIFEHEVKMFNPDVIHFHYWDTANTLSKSPVCDGRKIMLTHHNQKDSCIYAHDWNNFDMLAVHTQKNKSKLTEKGYWNISVVQHGIDIEKFKYIDNFDFNEGTGYDCDNKKIGYVGRIVPWKNLYEILKASKELGTKTMMMGRIDKPDYWAKCQEFKDQMDIRFDTPDDKQVEVYHEMGVYVGNSVDDLEEGPLGLLEAMACGIPVVTTPSGEGADIIKDGENGILVEFENYDSLKKGLERFFAMSPEEKNKMRWNAWNTVRHMSQEVMARNYEKIYYDLVHKNDLVSVIIPTFNRQDSICNVLDGYKRQTYQPVELIVVDDNSKDETFEKISEWKKANKEVPLKYINTKYEGYGLARARNEGIFEASGNYILFSDDRFIPDEQAVQAFVSNLKQTKEPSAVWGDKGAGKRDFIENFFMIRKEHIANAGMFNERINEYGGQRQEIRERLRKLGYKLHFEPAAKSDPQFGTKNRSNRKYELFRTKTKLWKLRN